MNVWKQEELHSGLRERPFIGHRNIKDPPEKKRGEQGVVLSNLLPEVRREGRRGKSGVPSCSVDDLTFRKGKKERGGIFPVFLRLELNTSEGRERKGGAEG